jgi:hypothetical protein
MATRRLPGRFAKVRAESITTNLINQLGAVRYGLPFVRITRVDRLGRPIRAQVNQDTDQKLMLTLNSISLTTPIRRAFSLTERQIENGWLIGCSARAFIWNSKYDERYYTSLSSITRNPSTFVASINKKLMRYGVYGKFEPDSFDFDSVDDSERFFWLEQLIVNVEMYIPKGSEKA